MKLYFFPLSGHAHRAHLFLSLIGAPGSDRALIQRARELLGLLRPGRDHRIEHPES